LKPLSINNCNRDCRQAPFSSKYFFGNTAFVLEYTHGLQDLIGKDSVTGIDLDACLSALMFSLSYRI